MRSIKLFFAAGWLNQSSITAHIQNYDGKLIKSFAEILNNPEKYVVEQETGSLISLK